MKVLLLSLYHPELVRGGAQQVCYELFEALKAKPDVEPVLLCAVDPSFDQLYKSGARITGFDGRPNEFLFLSRDYDGFWHKTSSRLLIESYVEFLLSVRPDVVHFHHFLLFGVDLVTVTRRTLPEARIVFTLHEYIPICAERGQMVRKLDGAQCDHASPVRCHQCQPEHGPERFFLREQWIKRHFEAVDLFTTPSRFMIDLYTRWGLERARLAHVPNGQQNRAGARLAEPPRAKRNRFGFFGQLVDNKGVRVLFEAVDQLRREGFTDFTVEINGDNIAAATSEHRALIEDYLEREAERPAGERLVVMNGSYEVAQLRQRMMRVDWCVVPSVWKEAFGLVISEAWMFGRPVIASDIGAMAERVRHEWNGLLFNAGDAAALAATLRRACTEPALWQALSQHIEAPASDDAMAEDFLKLYR